MKIKVRRVKKGADGYELYDSDTGMTIRSGITAAQVCEGMILPQVEVILKVVHVLIGKADREFGETGFVLGDGEEIGMEGEQLPDLVAPLPPPDPDRTSEK
jgi:hypothetical protein